MPRSDGPYQKPRHKGWVRHTSMSEDYNTSLIPAPSGTTTASNLVIEGYTRERKPAMARRSRARLPQGDKTKDVATVLRFIVKDRQKGPSGNVYVSLEYIRSVFREFDDGILYRKWYEAYGSHKQVRMKIGQAMQGLARGITGEGSMVDVFNDTQPGHYILRARSQPRPRNTRPKSKSEAKRKATQKAAASRTTAQGVEQERVGDAIDAVSVLKQGVQERIDAMGIDYIGQLTSGEHLWRNGGGVVGTIRISVSIEALNVKGR